MLLRSALEQATHRVVVRRRPPPPFGAARIYVVGRRAALSRARHARVDPALVGLATESMRPGDTAWDIGANLGLFSFAAAVTAGPSGRVLAMEPDTAPAGLRRRAGAVYQGHAPVDVLPAAVSDQESAARSHIASWSRSTNHLDGFGTIQAGGVRTTQLQPYSIGPCYGIPKTYLNSR